MPRQIQQPDPNLPERVEQRPGHTEIIGETVAKLLLFQHGWNPYTRFLDVDKVDIVLRRNLAGQIDYREIQVKYRRIFPANPRAWDSRFFKETVWYAPDAEEFSQHRDSLFVIFIFGHENRVIDSDVLIFPSGRLHEIIQLAPLQKKGGNQRVLYISRSADGSRWYVRRTRSKFQAIDNTSCIDVTEFNRNFDILK